MGKGVLLFSFRLNNKLLLLHGLFGAVSGLYLNLRAPTQIALGPLCHQRAGRGWSLRLGPQACLWLCTSVRGYAPGSGALSWPRACLPPIQLWLHGMANVQDFWMQTLFFQHMLPWKDDLSWEEGHSGWSSCT